MNAEDFFTGSGLGAEIVGLIAHALLKRLLWSKYYVGR